MKSIVLFLLILLVLVTPIYCQVQPTIIANGPLELAPTSSVTLSILGFTQYRWTRNNVDVVSTQSSIITGTPGYYRVEVSNGGIWQVSSPVRITVRPGTGSADKSYSQEDVVLQEGILSEADIDLAQTKRGRTLTYLDGLMRPTQQIVVRATAETSSAPNGLDMVQFYEYDAIDQQPRSYLPYVGGSDGSFKSNALAEQRAFYSNSGPAKTARVTNNLTYAETVFEDTPGGSAIEQGGAGTSWQVVKDANGKSTFQGHTKRMLARGSTGGEVAIWSYTPGAEGLIGTASFTFDAPGSISVTQLTDEDGKQSWKYTNSLGQIVATETLASPRNYLTTATAYDEAGRIVMTMSPEGVKRAVNSGEALSTEFLARWAFLYRFDALGRAIAKKVPGKEWEYTIYDRWNRAVASQSGNQRQQGKWAYTKYDELNRPIITGQITDSRSQQALSDALEAGINAGTFSRYELKANTATSTIRIGYSRDRSFPINPPSNELLTISYYDDYSFLNGSQDKLRYYQESAGDLSIPALASTLTIGLPTISQTRILGSTAWLTSVIYYDDKARTIQIKSENQLGGVERLSTEYDYAGKVLKKYTAHNLRNNTPTHTILYRYTYYSNDSPNELFVQFNKNAGGSELLLSKKEYNELGQLVDDKLGRKNSPSPTYLQSVDYRYNIRGWLTHINNRDLQSGVATNEDSDAEGDLFGFELKYDTDLQTNSTTAHYNGNIAESLWQSRRNLKMRGYGYHYDNANRITGANYSAYYYTGSAWGWNGEKDDAAGMGRFTTSDIEYDMNGNITRMNRVGHKSTVSNQAIYGPIDQLHYSYGTAGGNQLRSVVDKAGHSSAPNDFEDTASSGDEYSYDWNANMTQDSNKGITVDYNELDLPRLIQFNNGNSISFTYTAAGEKLTQAYSNATYDYAVNYVGGFVYGQGPLLTIATPVGRALYGSTPDNSTQRWMQEYHIRDHLGNLRLAFRDEGRNVQRLVATMEQVNAAEEEKHFDNLTATRQLDSDHSRTGSYAARLNAGQNQRMFGPSASVKVNAGDSVNFEVYGRYDIRYKASLWPAILPIAAAANTPTITATNDSRSTTRRGLLPKLATGITLAWTALPHLFERRQETPRASIKYDLYDQDSNFVASETRYLDHSAANEWQRLEVGFKAKENGYVLISLQNATAEDVWFDDAELRTTSDMIVQENHYDPWGQNLVNIEYEGTPNEQWQYSDKERVNEIGWADYGTRYYDSQLGRWHTPDPADQFTSPYIGLGNNPIVGTDPDGRFWNVVIGAVVGAYSGYKIGQAKGASGWSLFGYTAAGAGIGALTGGFGGLIAGSGAAFANTGSIVFSSYSASMGMKILSGGSTPLSVGFGAASYNFDRGEFGFLGKKGNSTIENIGYGLGAFTNISDTYGFVFGGTETVDLVSSGHSKIMKDGNFLYDFGTDLKGWESILGDGKQLGDAFKKASSTNDYFLTGKEANLTDGLVATGRHQSVRGVNLTKLATYKYATEGRNAYSLAGIVPIGSRNCSAASSAAFLHAGVFNIPFGVPGVLSFQMFLRQYSPVVSSLLKK
ncbi:DUF6443 domain-containing protein [Hymenobacter actinosclerus]|uniref:RHS repeat-associated core domain-containing protein n=1 Tax=Hymenobacter actinosclerus TaxID=82805 RepID=A0A1I0IJ10_9BACT|nr:DUF6443 domain-containing protein [Hymenobacter actinosclerus]SET97010.1 RHS repeat-associated core domain-containing protein [Hymenobacter actinosclerus]